MSFEFSTRGVRVANDSTTDINEIARPYMGEYNCYEGVAIRKEYDWDKTYRF